MGGVLCVEERSTSADGKQTKQKSQEDNTSSKSGAGVALGGMDAGNREDVAAARTAKFEEKRKKDKARGIVKK